MVLIYFREFDDLEELLDLMKKKAKKLDTNYLPITIIFEFLDKGSA